MEVWLLLLGGTSHSSFIFIYINKCWRVEEGGGVGGRGGLKGIRVSGLNEVI